MRLTIRHETVYTFTQPASYTIQLLRLTPPQTQRQRVIDWTLETPGRRHRHVDAYGNVTHTLVVSQPHTRLRIAVRGLVEVTARADGRLSDDEPADSGLPREVFQVPTPLTAPDEAIAAFGRAVLPQGMAGPQDALRLAEAIRDAVVYESGVTDVATPAAAALAHGRGVCQDHAHLALAVARQLGVPARYVSGYIHPGDTRHAASHAWLDLWFPSTGWVAVDVTHAQFTSDWHVRVAVGRDYASAGPVRGVRTGGGEESMDVSVVVTTPDQ
jgi:transglutaminase-like putative cysteine protease